VPLNRGIVRKDNVFFGSRVFCVRGGSVYPAAGKWLAGSARSRSEQPDGVLLQVQELPKRPKNSGVGGI
jgi:hypothetical protein